VKTCPETQLKTSQYRERKTSWSMSGDWKSEFSNSETMKAWLAVNGEQTAKAQAKPWLKRSRGKKEVWPEWILQ
jgi:hypothetical protein